MNAQEIRERAMTSPDWLAVELVKRIETLEAQVEALKKKPVRKKRAAK